MSHAVSDLLRRMMTVDATKRITMKQTCRHQWTRGGNAYVPLKPSQCSHLVSDNPADDLAKNDIVENIAAVKDQSEIDALQTAVDITDRVFDLILPEIKVGVTEKHIAARLSYLFKQEGGDGDSYDPIVASGANGALPHATPSDNEVKKGDFIVMDFGSLYKGYHADMTRTIVVGEASERHHEIYNIM